MSQPTIHRSTAATSLGWITYLLTLAFSIGLTLTLMAATWFDLDAVRGWLGFFGFGIAMLLAGVATAALWDGEKTADILGWTAILYAVANGIFVLLVLANLLLSQPPTDPGWPKTTEPVAVKEHERAKAAYTTADNKHSEHRTVQITCLLGFAVCMIVTGAVGVAMLKVINQPPPPAR